MSLYVYQKSLPETKEPEIESPKEPKNLRHFLPLTVSFLGLLLVGFVVWPILSYELNSSRLSTYTPNGLLNPAVESLAVSSAFAAAPQVVNQIDFTQAINWFPTAPLKSNPSITTTPKSYTISIPKLRIENALVRNDTMDLSQSLIHYPDTAFPGQLGSAVIFGHSILPQFYNPKNYMSIFSLLPQLSQGDLIYITFDSVAYTYQVTDKKEVLPSDLSPLEQQYDSKKIRLITCVPPGLKTRRLVVTALLQ